LAREPAVAFVAGESGDGGLTLISPDGDAEVRRLHRHVLYRPRTGDPLGLGGPRVGTDDQWLACSASDLYPDAAVQLLQLFRSPRTGDLVVVADEGFDLRGRLEFPSHRAGHGSLLRAHMEIPLWSSRPLPAERLRSVDLFPAMLAWLGLDVPHPIDGRLVWRPCPAAPERRFACAS
ncbi:MAG TPA: hypothetical protein VFB89_09840, partial [Gemmatimonadales bacterium]|nr:hypothetical protein [Gemmatimonadales bacterium]